jgi:hypothetical protein
MAERYIPEHRRTQFKAKNQFKPDELRRRREEQQVEIRKQKRDDNLAKRRGIQTRDGGIGVGGMTAATESDDEASAIESEVGLRLFFDIWIMFHFYLSCVGWILPSAASLATPCVHLRFLCFYDAIINKEFFFTARLPWPTKPLQLGTSKPCPTAIKKDREKYKANTMDF